jgi:hypothetical protein
MNKEINLEMFKHHFNNLIDAFEAEKAKNSRVTQKRLDTAVRCSVLALKQAKEDSRDKKNFYKNMTYNELLTHHYLCYIYYTELWQIPENYLKYFLNIQN